MTDAEKLMILKSDLQMMTSSNDDYLNNLMTLAKSAIEREGIKLGDDVESGMAQTSYAAYLFRKRAGDNTEMPRFLRYQLNNMLFSQKGKTDDV